MTKRRFQLLDEIDFVWDVYNAAWNSKFVELKEYKELHGDCLVNTGHNANALGRWVSLFFSLMLYFYKYIFCISSKITTYFILLFIHKHIGEHTAKSPSSLSRESIVFYDT